MSLTYTLSGRYESSSSIHMCTNSLIIPPSKRHLVNFSRMTANDTCRLHNSNPQLPNNNMPALGHLVEPDCVWPLLALDSARAGVAFGSVTGDGLHLLLLEVLVGLLLPLPVHGAGWWASELSDAPEREERHADTSDSVKENLLALTGRRNGAGTVGTEGDPVRSLLLSKRELSPVGLHPIPQRHPQLSLLLRRHGLPSLLDVGQRRIGDGVGGSGPLGEGDGSGEAGRRSEESSAHHFFGIAVGEWRCGRWRKYTNEKVGGGPSFFGGGVWIIEYYVM